MRVLVFQRDSAELARIVEVLHELGHEVRQARSEGEALAHLQVQTPEVALLDIGLPHTEGLGLVRFVRGLVASHYIFVVAMVRSQTDDLFHVAYEVGCDGELRLPCVPGQLRARLKVAERIHSRIASSLVAAVTVPAPAPVTTPVTTPTKEAAASGNPKEATASGNPKEAAASVALPAHAPRPAPAQMASAPVAPRSALAAAVLCPAWVKLPSDMHRVACGLLSLGFAISTTDAAAPTIHIASGIVMHCVADELELRLAIAVDLESAKALASHVSPENRAGRESDLLRELSNIAMGSLTSSFMRDSFAFSSGLPEVLDPVAFRSFGANLSRHERITLTAPGATIQVRVSIGGKQATVLSPAGLSEGMVIAKDVYNEKGTLLLKSGTRLSSNMVGRLRDTLASSQLIEVATAAAA